jgi:murein DD-endopeptidase MepM/ murein hydrolase activator NlpD
VDIAGAEQTPIIAPAKGTVAFVGKDGALGMSVRIKHDSACESTYGHLNKAAVKKGQHVERGEVIGYMGNSGRSTGSHLHYEIEKNRKNVNPFQYMMDWKTDNLVMLAE